MWLWWKQCKDGPANVQTLKSMVGLVYTDILLLYCYSISDMV